MKPAEQSSNFIVVGQHPWNQESGRRLQLRIPGNWTYVDDPVHLTAEHLSTLEPRYVFFLHWSRRVPDEVISRFECVCFHMTDVPYGRGGSPLQNLISLGHVSTRLSALRMVREFDAGPVYLKEDLSLLGSAEEILLRAGRLCEKMIEEIIRTSPIPVPQEGEATYFTRRRPEQSRLPEGLTLEQAYDHIRMLDAEGYPHAFLDHGGLRFEFRRASLRHGRLEADVRITHQPPPQP